MAHACVSNLTIIGSDNGLSPDRHQAIIWTNAGIFLIGLSWTNFSRIFIKSQIFSFKENHLEMLSGKWRTFCPGLNVISRCLNYLLHFLPQLIVSTFGGMYPLLEPQLNVILPPGLDNITDVTLPSSISAVVNFPQPLCRLQLNHFQMNTSKVGYMLQTLCTDTKYTFEAESRYLPITRHLISTTLCSSQHVYCSVCFIR